jgi:hypothetical protein
MSVNELSGFLAEVRTILATLDIDRRVALSQFRGSEMFAECGPEFHQRLSKYLSAPAIEAIDKVSYNAFWFVLMVGTTLVVADQFPAGAEDVAMALRFQRRIVTRDPGMPALLAKVGTGNFDKLTRRELEEAGQRSLLLMETSGPEGGTLIFNPVFLQ